MVEQPMRITVLGRGAWGATLAGLWQATGHTVDLWSRRDGGSPLPLLAGSDLVVAAVSMAAIGELSELLAPAWPTGLPLLSCSKGIAAEGLLTAGQIWCRRIPGLRLAVLSGPNLAAELARGLPAASVIASRDGPLAGRLQQALATPCLRLYTNDDPTGTETAGALKNVMAVAAGISDGLGLGANARASLLCRGLAEMGVVLTSLGGRMATLYGLAGMGDLLATATSDLSRNYRFGSLLAQGLDAQSAVTRIGATVEGPGTATAALQLALRDGLDLPICAQVVAIISGESPARAAVEALMRRDFRPETGP
ncbi:MAG: NAD(P)H-dependent glycerol-3-phosphate dehydrogenase [Cyanobacteriota bacterium]